MVKGWTDEDVVLTARLIFNTFNSGGSEGPVAVVMEPSYHLGPRPEIEMHVRNFLSSAFFKEVAFGQERLWLETLLLQVSPMRNIPIMSRVLLLISSLSTEQDWQFGFHWADHFEAIPATYAVASAQ
jgi:hypothetical protein